MLAHQNQEITINSLWPTSMKTHISTWKCQMFYRSMIPFDHGRTKPEGSFAINHVTRIRNADTSTCIYTELLPQLNQACVTVGANNHPQKLSKLSEDNKKQTNHNKLWAFIHYHPSNCSIGNSCFWSGLLTHTEEMCCFFLDIKWPQFPVISTTYSKIILVHIALKSQ